MKTAPQRYALWTRLPDTIEEEEFELQISWTADERTTEAILRQSELMGFESGTDYLIQLITAIVADSEKDTYVNDAGELASGCEIDRP